MMQRLDRILAVIDPTVDVQVGARKAVRLARAYNASLELFACDFAPALTAAPFFDTDHLRQLRERLLAERTHTLETLAAGLRTDGLEVTTHAHWDHPLHEGILRRVEEFAPDLVVKETHYHPPVRRALFSNTDWHLIRACPVPLLLARQADWPERPVVMAALDPDHRHSKPVALDTDILAAARLVAGALDGTVEIVHAFFPAALLAATTGMAGAPMAADVTWTDLLEAERARVTAALHETVEAAGMTASAVRVLQGSAAEALPRHAELAGAAMLVMGAVTRGRLRERLIGSTAERVLDRLSCDVLVVKPVDFVQTLPF
jgi:universal stress protein E